MLVIFVVTIPVCPNRVIDPSKVNHALMKHNSARGANTMEFPIGKFARGANTMEMNSPIGKFAGGANTMVKAIDLRRRP